MALFDVALHLIGGQNIPNYIAIKHLDAEKHILLTTGEMMEVAKRLKGSLIEYGSRIVIEGVDDAFHLDGLIHQFTTLRQRYEGKRVALNVTGGTKLMALMLLHAFYEMKGRESFYIEAHNRNELISITKNKVLPLAPCFEDANTFVSLQSLELLSRYKDRRPGEAELAVARELRKIRVEVLKDYTHFFAGVLDKYRRARGKLGKEDYEGIAQKTNGVRALFSSEESKTDFDILKDELSQEMLWGFLGGRWFEAYTYGLFQSFSEAAKQKVRGLRLGVPVYYKDKEAEKKERQELDLAYTDGFALWAIECKARKQVDQEDILKVESNVLRYGGTFGRGVLVSAYKQSEKVLERMKTSKNVMLVHGEDVEHLEEALLNWHPGVWTR